jgi:hypothetical protein
MAIKKYYPLSGLCLSLCLGGCLVSCQHQPKHPVPQPKLNPHPKYFVTISGNIQPHMRYPMTVKFKAVYAGYHPQCQVWVNKLAGVPGLPAHHKIYAAHPDAKGNYAVRIPIDAYLPGKCQWKMAWVMEAIMSTTPKNKDEKSWPWFDSIHFGRFSANELPSFPIHTKALSLCGKGGFEQCTGTDLIPGYTKYVPRETSYHFIQDIKSKKGEQQ